MEEEKDKEVMSESVAETPPVAPAETPADVPADAVVEVEEKTEDAEPAPVSETEAEVEKIRAEYDEQLQKLQAKIQAMEAEKVAMARAAAIKSICEKSGYADLAGALEGATEVDEELAKKLCKFMSDMQAKSTSDAAAITPDGEATDVLAEDDIPLADMTADQIRARLGKKKLG